MPDDPARGFPPPRKRFGQHFLTDQRALDRIVDTLGPGPHDTVVEIGPGRGALTDRLVRRCGRLLAVEIDRDLVRHLQERYADSPAVEVLEGDALEVDWAARAGKDYLLAGNLPYYITTPLLFRVLEPPRPRRAVLLVQKEVADRLAAGPGDEDYGAMTVNVQAASRVRVVAKVSAGSFHPKPAVDSAIICLTPLEEPLVAPGEEDACRRFVQAAFGMRRKQLIRVVRELTGLDANIVGDLLLGLDLDSSARPETLSPREFVALHRAIRA